VARICNERPLVEVEVHIGDSGGLVERIAEGHYDFAIVVGDSPLKAGRLIGEPIGEDELLVVAAANWHPELRSVTVEELAEFPFIDSPQGLIRRIFVDDALRKLGLSDRKIAASLDHPEAVKRVTEAGLGVTILFRSAVAKELATGTLRELPIDGVHLAGSLYLVRRRDKLFSAFQQYLAEQIREHLAMQPSQH